MGSPFISDGVCMAVFLRKSITMSFVFDVFHFRWDDSRHRGCVSHMDRQTITLKMELYGRKPGLLLFA
jgi:hypothetical protein